MVNISEFDFLYYQAYLLDIIANDKIDIIDFDIIPKQVIPNIIKMIFYEKSVLLSNFDAFRKRTIILLENTIFQAEFSFDERQEYVDLLKEIRQLSYDRNELVHFYFDESTRRKQLINSFHQFKHSFHCDYLLLEMIKLGRMDDRLSSYDLKHAIIYLKAKCRTYNYSKKT